jgi:CheY-like chemotaxis protein
VRVLLAEDNPTDARLLQGLLKTARGGKFEIKWVDTVALTVERLRSGWPDVLLLDLTLPDSDGLETVLTARSAAPTLPLIVLTGLNDMELAKSAFRAGVQDYLIKDQVSREVLLRSLRYAIERADLESSLRHREAELNALLTAIPDTVFRLRRGGAVEVLKAPDALDGASAKTIEDLLPIEAAGALMAHLAQVLTGCPPAAVSCRIPADGAEHFAHVAPCTPDEAVVLLRRGN